MHKSAVREYRPDNMELAAKKAKLREAKRMLAQLTEEIQVLQKRVDESKNVEIQEVTEEEEMEFKVWQTFFFFFYLIFFLSKHIVVIFFFFFF